MKNNQEVFDELLEVLTEKMIKNSFDNHDKDTKKFVMTEQELFQFCIKLVKMVKEVYYGN